MKKIYAFFTLLVCFLVSSPAIAETASTTLTDGYYYILNGYTGRRLTEISGNALSTVTIANESSTPEYSAVWHVVKDASASTYSIQNLRTGNYIQLQASENGHYVTGTPSYGFSLVESFVRDGVQNYYIRNNVTDTKLLGLHSNATTTVFAWGASGTADAKCANEWIFKAVTLTDVQINQEAKSLYTGRSGIYTITSAGQSGVLKEDVSTGSLTYEASTATDAAPEYLALWRLTETSQAGVYTLQNVGTTNYVQPQSTNNSQYAASVSTAKLYLRLNATVNGTEYWNIGNDANMTESLNAQPDSKKVVAWNSVSNDGDTSNGEWTLTPVTLTDAQVSAAESTYSQYKRYAGWYKFINHYNGLALYDNTTGSGQYLRLQTFSESDLSHYWYVTGTMASGFKIENAKTGRCISDYTATALTGATVYPHPVTENGTTYYTFGLSTSDNNRIHCGSTGATNYNVIKWATDGSGSQYTLTEVTLSDADVLAARAAFWGYATPATGKYYQIYNPSRGTYLSIQGAYGQLQHVGEKTTDYARYSQYWQLEAAGDGYRLKNVYTNLYMDNTKSGRSYTTSADGDAFYVVANGSFHLMPYYNIRQNLTATQTPHAQSDGAVVDWDYATNGTLTATEWTFKEVSLTEEQIAAAQADYNTVKNAVNNASSYATALATFFSDNTCTTLKSDYQAMSDADLKAAMATAGLPEQFQTMAVKIKNSAWANKYEERFRIANYEPYSDPSTWANTLGCYPFTSYEQPTGIYSNEGDLLYVYVSQAAPANATLQLRILPAGSSSSNCNYTLHAGLNVIYPNETGNAFIAYHCTTADGGTMLSAYPNVKVHIEGGTLNGYFDSRTATTDDPRRGMTNEDWVEMQNLGLLSCTTINMRSEKLMFSMNGAFVKSANATTMRDNLAVWDSIVTWEDDLFGASDKHWANFSKYCNNIYGAHTITTNYMYATNYGTYYNRTYGGMDGVLRLDRGGAIWGPAHENGHCRQQHINIIGDTEVSNNVFSNMCVWKRGDRVSRGNKTTDALDAFNAGKFYLDYGDVRIRMYWQLYLYYEVAGHHPGFFPELFKALRADPMIKKNGAANTNYGKDNYLKFALKCCEVSGDDLTDFFQAWGFFVPVTRYYVKDYADYYITTTADEIAEVKAEMAKYKSGAENILFIEDRIEPSPAEYAGASATATRTAIDVAVGDGGDVGSFLDYKTTANTKATNYLYTLSGSTVTIAATADGAVGYKVYNANGELVALYNKNTFTLPTNLADGYTIVAAQADGTDVEIPNSASTYYPLTAYYGTAEAKTVNVTKTIPAATAPNAIYVVNAATNAPASITEATNVVVKSEEGEATAADLVLTDKADFYAPTDFTATSVSYERATLGTYNSVCLPFATTASDFGSSSLIYTIGSLATDETCVYITKQQEAEAGQPVLVYSPDETAWTITKTNAKIAATPVTSVGSAATLLGSFTNKSIGADKYKLNVSGTAFGVTTAAGKVTAFRSYMQVNSENAAARFAVRIADDATGISAPLTPTTSANDPSAWYDLQGRRVLRSTTGIYLHGGKKVIVR